MHPRRRKYPLTAVDATRSRASRLRLLVALCLAMTLMTGSSSSGLAAQNLGTPVDQTVAQILEFPGGLSRGLVQMIEEEGFLCVMAFHPVPAGMSWVCTPLP